MITTKIKEQEKSKGKEKELTKNKKQQNTFCNDFSTITHRSNNTKGNSLSNIKQSLYNHSKNKNRLIVIGILFLWVFSNYANSL